MNLYLAPLEGLTGNIFRTNLHKVFGGVDKFFTPFITPCGKGKFSTKIYNDILPENNKGQRLVPQILTDSAEGFLTMCERLSEFGYDEFNLNLGCPSGTVVSKGRGAGFLAYPDELDRFLDGIFGKGYKISVKTRIGKENAEEFVRLLEIYNKYPMTELIVHPRTRKDMYNGIPDLKIYEYAVENSKNKLCYNGNIFTPEDLNCFLKKFPDTENVMIGRGAVKDPAVFMLIRGEARPDKARYIEFYKGVYEDYAGVLSGSTHLLHKMKEVTLHLSTIFETSDKTVKHIKKAKNIRDFDAAVSEMFACDLKNETKKENFDEEFKWYI